MSQHWSQQLPAPAPTTSVIDSGLVGSTDFDRRGSARAEDVHGTPGQSHISPSILVYEDNIAERLWKTIEPAVESATANCTLHECDAPDSADARIMRQHYLNWNAGVCPSANVSTHHHYQMSASHVIRCQHHISSDVSITCQHMSASHTSPPSAPISHVMGGGATRAEDAQRTPTQSSASPSILVYEDHSDEYGRVRTFVPTRGPLWGYLKSQFSRDLVKFWR